MTTEAQIQAAVVQHLFWRAPRAVVIHPANGGKRDIITAVQLKRMGVVPGAPDLIIFDKGEAFALEIKKEGGRASLAQLAFQGRMIDAGFKAEIVYGLDEALATLKRWGIL